MNNLACHLSSIETCWIIYSTLVILYHIYDIYYRITSGVYVYIHVYIYVYRMNAYMNAQFNSILFSRKKKPTIYIYVNIVQLIFLKLSKIELNIGHKSDDVTHGVGTVLFTCKFCHKQWVLLY